MGVIAVTSGTKMKRLQVSNLSTLSAGCDGGMKLSQYMLQHSSKVKQNRICENVTWPTFLGLS